MKFFFAAAVLMISSLLKAQSTQNLILITTDGFRWQDLFNGMDTAIANQAAYNQGDSSYIFKKYWDPNPLERRRKLLPFLWTTVAEKGQLFGNRTYHCQVDNANSYWFSYPGYNEILTGYPDTAINANNYPPNPHENVFEFLQKKPGYRGRVAVFGAWEAFNRILNETRCGFPVIAGFDATGGKNPSSAEILINKMNRDAFRPFGEEECLDVFTHYAAMEYLRSKKPKLLYIAYGETDEWAHAGHYRSYLDAAHQVDAWIREIWEFVLHDPQYRDHTTLFITTDHGRGDQIKDEWTKHNSKIMDSHEIWFAVMGPAAAAGGEVKKQIQLYQAQFAQTISRLSGYHFKTSHPVAAEIPEVFKRKQ